MISEYVSSGFLKKDRSQESIKSKTTLTALVLTSQLLLLALAVAWFVHMVLIAVHGKIFFAEPNPFILYGEITATFLIALFAIIVFVMQWKRSWNNLDN